MWSSDTSSSINVFDRLVDEDTIKAFRVCASTFRNKHNDFHAYLNHRKKVFGGVVQTLPQHQIHQVLSLEEWVRNLVRHGVAVCTYPHNESQLTISWYVRDNIYGYIFSFGNENIYQYRCAGMSHDAEVNYILQYPSSLPSSMLYVSSFSISSRCLSHRYQGALSRLLQYMSILRDAMNEDPSLIFIGGGVDLWRGDIEFDVQFVRNGVSWHFKSSHILDDDALHALPYMYAYAIRRSAQPTQSRRDWMAPHNSGLREYTEHYLEVYEAFISHLTEQCNSSNF